MTGLDLESFLHLLRADLGAWASLGLVLLVLALMAWTSWGSRRALRKCLVLSIAAHIGLLLYGSTFPIMMAVLGDKARPEAEGPPVRVQLAPSGGESPDPGGRISPDGRPARAVANWDRAGEPAGLAGPTGRAPRPGEPVPAGGREPGRTTPAALAPEAVVLEVNPPPPTAPTNLAGPTPPAPAPTVAPGDPAEVPAAVADRATGPAPAESIAAAARSRPDRAAVEPTKPLDGARPPLTAPGLAATPAPGPVAPADPRPSAPAAGPQPAPVAVALADPSDVAAPSLGAKVVDPDPGSVGIDATAPGGASARARARREATSPGASPLALLDPARPSPAPLAPSTTTVAPPGRAPATVATARPAAAGPVAAREVAPPSATADAPAEGTIGPTASRLPASPAPRESLPETDARRQSRPAREAGRLALNERRPDRTTPAALPRVTPSGTPAPPAIAGASGLTRPPADVPSVYRSRLDPNRFALARRAGASRESEQAVERALEWLRRHQDADGRWDGGTARYKDGSVAEADDDYTIHCPPGDVCYGECFYWEADTAVTGLALLAYLGAGYTHVDGQYAETVGRGLDFLRMAQKADGDLRGRSQAVGMYCHAMATLALCEAYALTGDPKLRGPVEKAVNFLVKGRAQDRMAWRYAPGAPVGDTSILGWVVMVLKSAQEVGIPIQPNTRQGVLAWLNKVSAGPSAGLARYQPWEKVTPTMTAEAWVCRQFLGVGGPGMSSTEAAEYLVQNGPSRSQYNLYYWYYGTLAMYQHGGEAWARWNAQVRDEIVRRQRTAGHASGSWDPDESQYGTHGGRIYGTALATLSLEVYYRYLRLYEAPATAPTPAPRSADGLPRRTADLLPEPAAPR